MGARPQHGAEHLAEQGAGPETVVAVLAERGVEWLTVWLGILGCGAVYLPLHPEHPAARLQHVLADSGAQIVVVSRDLESRLGDAVAGLMVGASAGGAGGGSRQEEGGIEIDGKADRGSTVPIYIYVGIDGEAEREY